MFDVGAYSVVKVKLKDAERISESRIIMKIKVKGKQCKIFDLYR